MKKKSSYKIELVRVLPDCVSELNIQVPHSVQPANKDDVADWREAFAWVAEKYPGWIPRSYSYWVEQ